MEDVTTTQPRNDLEDSLTPGQLERVFELVKITVTRLGNQEQSLMDARLTIWLVFFGIVSGPSGYAGAVGVREALVLIALIPFFTMCLSLHIKHSEMVLRYDIRKNLKAIALEWHYTSNHDSKFSKQEQKKRKRWWHGWYRYAMAGIFLIVEIAVTVFIRWWMNTNGLGGWSTWVTSGEGGMTIITGVCMLL
jgi:hypothetical protein